MAPSADSQDVRNSSSADPVVPDVPGGYGSATPVRVLWIGNPSLALEFAGERPSELHVTACDCAMLGALLEAVQADGGQAFDGVVLDTTADGVDVPGAVELLDTLAPDLAVVLVVSPDVGAARAAETSTAIGDYLVKTPDFMHQLVPTLAQVRARHDLANVFRATSEREARLRAILDLQPAVALLVDADGRMTAVNQAGLRLFADGDGAAVAGRRFLEFVPEDERHAVRVLFAGDSALAWAEHTLNRADGSALQVRTRVAPFVYGAGAASLVSVDDLSSGQLLFDTEPASIPDEVAQEPDDDDEGWEDVIGEGFDESLPEAAAHPPAEDTTAATLSVLAADHSELQQRHDALRESAEAERAALTARLEQAQAQQSLDAAERQRLESALSEAQALADATESRLASAEASRLELASSLAAVTTRLDTLSSTVQRSEAAAVVSEAGAADQARARERLEQEHARVSAALREAMAANSRHVEAFARQAAEMQAVSAEAQRLGAELESARRTIEAAEADRAALSETRRTEHEHHVATLRDALSDLQALAADCDRQEHALASARSDRRIKEAALATSLHERERLTAAFSEAAHETATLSAELTTRNQAVSTLQGQLDVAAHERTTLAAEHDRLAALLADAMSDRDRLTSDLRASQALAERAQRECETAMAEVTRLTAEHERAATALTDATVANQRLAAEQAQSAAALETAQRAMSELTSERTRMAADRERLSRALQAVVSNLDLHAGSPTVEPPPVHEEMHPSVPVGVADPVPTKAPEDAAIGAHHDATSSEPVDGRDRRRHPRINATFDGERLGLMDTPVHIQNLSVSGCFVTTYYPPPSDPRFELKIDLGKHGVVVVEVQTMYVSPEIGYGVSFVTVTDLARRRIEAAVEDGKATSYQRRRSPRNTPAA